MKSQDVSPLAKKFCRPAACGLRTEMCWPCCAYLGSIGTTRVEQHALERWGSFTAPALAAR